MASVQRYTVKGKSYWRIVESRRVNGKPRAIPIFHLGTADSLLAKLQKGGGGPLSVRTYAHGEVAALKEIADELGIVDSIDRYAVTPKRGISVGMSLFLVAMNRLIDPCSKRSIGEWAEGTSIKKLFPTFHETKLTSQFFWDQMQSLPLQAIPRIEAEITKRIVEKFNLTLDTLFFDTTNCYTYLQDETVSSIARYGHSKEKQTHRRLFGVALLVSRTGEIPLCHHTFPGNAHDSTQFPIALATLKERLEILKLNPADITLVFDRGNNSKVNFKALNEAQLGFVASLRVGDVSTEHFDVTLKRFSHLKSGRQQGMAVFRSKLEFDGTTYTSVLYLCERIQQHQVDSLNDQLQRKLAELHEWKLTLLNHTARNADDAKLAERRIQRILCGPYINEILSISYDCSKKLELRLQFSVNEERKAQIVQQVFGRRIIITNRHAWSSEEIVTAYFAQATVEHAFRSLKDDHSIAIRPQFHWTDHSITVHVFTCYLALLLARVLLLKARAVDPALSLGTLLQQLSRVRLAALLSTGDKKSNPICTWKLESMPTLAQALFNTCVPNSPFH